MPSIHPYHIIPYSLVHAHTRGVSTRRKRNQLIRRLPTYHAKQRQCLNSPKRVTIDTAGPKPRQSRSVYNDCLKHSDLLKVSTSARCADTQKRTDTKTLIESLAHERCTWRDGSQRQYEDWPKLATSRHLYAYINRHSTASLLTAATLAYASGAGITAAAGTRLALQ